MVTMGAVRFLRAALVVAMALGCGRSGGDGGGAALAETSRSEGDDMLVLKRSGGVPGPSTASSPVPGAPMHVSGHPLPPPVSSAQWGRFSYYDRLMELRKSYDLMPWLEVVKGGQSGAFGIQFAANAANQSVVQGIVNNPYSIIAQELVVGGVDTAPVVGTTAVNFDIAEFDGARPRHQPDPVIDWLLAGNVWGGWAQYPSGLMIDKNTQHVVVARARAAVGATHLATEYAVYRGYRLFEKGSQPVQRTYEEYAALGYRLEKYQLPLQLTPGNSPSVAEVAGDITFPADFAVEGIAADYGGLLSPLYSANVNQDPHPKARNYLLKIEPTNGTPLQNDFASLPLAAYLLQGTSTRWPIPYFVAKDRIWHVKLRKDQDDLVNGQQITVFVYGAKLIPPGQ